MWLNSMAIMKPSLLLTFWSSLSWIIQITTHFISLPNKSTRHYQRHGDMVLYYGRVQQDRYILNTRDVQSLLNAHQRKPERQPLTKDEIRLLKKNFGQRWFGGGGNGKSVHYRLQFQQQRLVAF